MAFNIVLLEPEIPANTGTRKNLRGDRYAPAPLSPGLPSERKGAEAGGMDYWPQLDVTTYVNYEDFLRKNPGARPYMATTKGPKVYTETQFEPDCYIMFGKESAGIPEEILLENQERAIRIPMLGDTRSLNLSNSVAIVLYEALRQNDFPGMRLEGHLTRYDWK